MGKKGVCRFFFLCVEVEKQALDRRLLEDGIPTGGAEDDAFEGNDRFALEHSGDDAEHGVRRGAKLGEGHELLHAGARA